MKMIDKITLENLVSKYETVDFIKNDPIQFPHRYCLKEDIEIAGFIASLFAYGKTAQSPRRWHPAGSPPGTFHKRPY